MRRRSAGLAGLLLAVACSSGGGGRALPSAAVTAPPTTEAATTPSTVPPEGCEDPGANAAATASLRPQGALPTPGEMPDGSFMREIQDEGRLIVGVADDQLLFSFLNPFNGQIEGFDVDIAKEVAEAIFGDRDAIELRAIAYSQRLPVLLDGSVHLVADTFTVNCVRDFQIDFSSVYYDSGQKVLVRTDNAATSIEELQEQEATVCAAAGSTSIDNVAALTGLVPVEVEDQTDCLVAFQDGDVDAISTDDTILAGLAAQDPFAKVVGEAFSAEPYGLGTSQDHPEFTRFVNGVLEQTRSDGSWAEIYERWLGEVFPGETPAPPTATYDG